MGSSETPPPMLDEVIYERNMCLEYSLCKWRRYPISINIYPSGIVHTLILQNIYIIYGFFEKINRFYNTFINIIVPPSFHNG